MDEARSCRLAPRIRSQKRTQTDSGDMINGEVDPTVTLCFNPKKLGGQFSTKQDRLIVARRLGEEELRKGEGRVAMGAKSKMPAATFEAQVVKARCAAAIRARRKEVISR